MGSAWWILALLIFLIVVVFLCCGQLGERKENRFKALNKSKRNLEGVK